MRSRTDIQALEEILLSYIERFGLTEEAKRYFYKKDSRRVKVKPNHRLRKDMRSEGTSTINSVIAVEITETMN